MLNFGLIGAAGYVAPRHIRAIRDTGNTLICAVDPNDSVGILDSYFLNVSYFSEVERFERYLEKRRRGPDNQRVHWLSICSPNYLHDAHIRMALRSGARTICEKPIVINPWNLDALQELEQDYNTSINTVLQLRLHPVITELKQKIENEKKDQKYRVNLTYITSRGKWYLRSWKGSEERSGGLVLNIGIHFFDILIWLFGKVQRTEVYQRDPQKGQGFIELENAYVNWFLSVDHTDLPFEPIPGQKTTFRSMSVDGDEVEFSKGFTDLHTLLYEKTLKDEGFDLEDARPSIELVHKIRTELLTEK